MLFSPTVEQHELAAVTRAFVARESDPQTRLAGLVRELGAGGIPVPEADGGLGLGWFDLGLVVHELGRVLDGSGFLAQTGLSLPLLIAGGRDWDVLVAQVVEGTSTIAGAPDSILTRDRQGRLTGMARAVLVADTTRAIVLPLEGGTGAVVQLDAAGARVRPRYTADLDRKVVDVEFDRVIPVMQASLADPDRAQSLAVSRALLAAEAVGAAERALEITIEHLRVRKQFGHPLAQFQALKHRCADDHVRLVTARSSTWYALRLADARQDATLAATIALHTARAAYRAIAESMVQLHGGVGYTWEHVAHRHLRRSLAICELLGGQGESEAEIAARGVVPAGAR